MLSVFSLPDATYAVYGPFFQRLAQQRLRIPARGDGSVAAPQPPQPFLQPEPLLEYRRDQLCSQANNDCSSIA